MARDYQLVSQYFAENPLIQFGVKMSPMKVANLLRLKKQGAGGSKQELEGCMGVRVVVIVVSLTYHASNSHSTIFFIIFYTIWSPPIMATFPQLVVVSLVMVGFALHIHLFVHYLP